MTVIEMAAYRKAKAGDASEEEVTSRVFTLHCACGTNYPNLAAEGFPSNCIVCKRGSDEMNVTEGGRSCPAP